MGAKRDKVWSEVERKKKTANKQKQKNHTTKQPPKNIKTLNSILKTFHFEHSVSFLPHTWALSQCWTDSEPSETNVQGQGELALVGEVGILLGQNWIHATRKSTASVLILCVRTHMCTCMHLCACVCECRWYSVHTAIKGNLQKLILSSCRVELVIKLSS